MSTVYKADGTETDEHPANGGKFSLKEMQAIVGGYIELVKLPHGMVLVVNEEGRLRQLALNVSASKIAGQPIVGDVLLCTRHCRDDDPCLNEDNK